MNNMRRFLNCCLLFVSVAPSLFAATSITYSGLTWTFADDEVVGTFANGEPWVVGPVTVTNISPGWTGTENGTMKNFDPITVPATYGQGWTASRTSGRNVYQDAKNVGNDLPLSLVAGDFIITMETGYDAVNRVWGQKAWILTVVSTSPAAGSFRPPPYASVNRAVRFNVSDMDLSCLPELTATAGAESAATIVALTPGLPWIEYSLSYTGGELLPAVKNCVSPRSSTGTTADSNYGREIAEKWGRVGLWLCTATDSADRDHVIIATVQAGIDLLGYFEAGGSLHPDGGHKCGRKFPAVFAAHVLGDAGLIDQCTPTAGQYWQEDATTWLVQESDVGRALAAGKTPYTSAHVGLYEWGIKHATEPTQDDSAWSARYRSTVWPAQAGAVLAAQIMGMEATWDHVYIFGYNARWESVSGFSGVTQAMWDAYSTYEPPPDGGKTATPSSDVAAGTYDATQTVTLTCATASSTIYYTMDGSAPTVASSVYSSPLSVSATTRIRAIGDSGTTSVSDELDITITIRCLPPTASPDGATLSVPVTVTLAAQTSASIVQYSLTSASGPWTTYTSPLLISETTTLYRRATKSGLSDSTVLDSLFTITPTSGGPFLSVWQEAVASQTENFLATFVVDGVPLGVVDAVVGLAPASGVDAFTDCFALVRFYTNGRIEARNGGAYASVNTVSYAEGVSYSFRVVVNLSVKTYDVFVTPSNSTETQIADDYAFCTEQASASALAAIAWITNASDVMTIDGIETYLSAPPVRARNSLRGGVMTLP